MISRLSQLSTVRFPAFPDIHYLQNDAVKYIVTLQEYLASKYYVIQFDAALPMYVPEECEGVVYLLNNSTDTYEFLSRIHYAQGRIYLPQAHPVLIARVLALYYSKITIFQQRAQPNIEIVYEGPREDTTVDCIYLQQQYHRGMYLVMQKCFRLNVAKLNIQRQTVALINLSDVPISYHLAYSIALKILREYKCVSKVLIVKQEIALEEFAIKRENDYYLNWLVGKLYSLYFPVAILKKALRYGASEVLFPLAATLAVGALQQSVQMVPCAPYIRKMILLVLDKINRAKLQLLLYRISGALRKGNSDLLAALGYGNIGLETCTTVRSIAAIVLNECCVYKLITPIYTYCEHLFGFTRLEISPKWIIALSDDFQIAKSTADAIEGLLYQCNFDTTKDAHGPQLLRMRATEASVDELGYQISDEKWKIIEYEFYCVLTTMYCL